MHTYSKALVNSVMAQSERARLLWPGIEVPPLPEFTPITSTERLLLHVPDTFTSLWQKITLPKEYGKFRPDFVKSENSSQLRVAPGRRTYDYPVWVAFDPHHGTGRAPASLPDLSILAASEVLSAMIQFPTWPLVWGTQDPSNGNKPVPFPNLAGYQVHDESGWVNTLMFDIMPFPEPNPWDSPSLIKMYEEGVRTALVLDIRAGGYGDYRVSSPSVRDLSF